MTWLVVIEHNEWFTTILYSMDQLCLMSQSLCTCTLPMVMIRYGFRLVAVLGKAITRETCICFAESGVKLWKTMGVSPRRTACKCWIDALLHYYQWKTCNKHPGDDSYSHTRRFFNHHNCDAKYEHVSSFLAPEYSYWRVSEQRGVVAVGGVVSNHQFVSWHPKS